MSENAICPVCRSPLASGVTVCSKCGFKLVGQTEQFEHIDVDKAGVSAVPRESLGTPTLTILKGPLAGEAFRLTSFPLVIGRDPECDLFLNDMTVTRHHASIDIIDGAVMIRDLNSLNGTWVDGEVSENARLEDGTIVQIGTFTMVFNI